MIDLRLNRPASPAYRAPERIAIVRALPGLGDLLCSVPAWRALRQAFPDAHITLIGLPWAESLAARFRCYLDDFLEFPGYPGIPERLVAAREFPGWLAAAQAREFDLAIQMQGNGSYINEFTVLLGARRAAGFYLPGLYCPDADHFLPYPDSGSEIIRQLRLLAFLGVPPQGTHLEFPLQEDDWDALAAISAARDLPAGGYVCVHPGARAAGRRWEPVQFARVADGLVRYGFSVVLTGSADESPLTAAVAAAMRHPALDLAGQTDLGALAALLRGARLLVSNDTGVSHLAAALRLPSVVIFTGSDPDRWAPLDHARHRVVIASTVDDSGVPLALGGRSTTVAPAPALKAADLPDAVLREAAGLLERKPEYAA
jgi:ADP-heptose:LPS heptosyltransferase